MKNWFVVYTQPRMEPLAETHLQRQGFEVYLPCYQKRRRHARKVDFVQAPLFPRYIFTAFDADFDNWGVINSTRGVVHLLRINAKPAIVPTHTIEALQGQRDENGLVSVESLSLFKKGQSVRITEGSFTGYTATFEGMDDKQRVQVLLEFLGRPTVVALPGYAVETG